MQNYPQTNTTPGGYPPQQGYNDPRYGQQSQGYPLYNPQQGYGINNNNYNVNNNSSGYAEQQNQGYYAPGVQGYQDQSGRNLNYAESNPGVYQPYPSNQPIYNPNMSVNSSIPPPIPPNSPLTRHRISQIIYCIKKNLSQFPQDFRSKFQQNQSFRSLNRKVVFIPSFLMFAHVLLNRKKKWFRLTVNAKILRMNLGGLFVLHLTTNFLYMLAYRDLVMKNREKIQKIIVREELLAGSQHSEKVV